MWNFNKLLGISGFEVIKYEKTNHQDCFSLRSRKKSADCIACHQKSFVRRGYCPVKKIKHGTILSKPCILVIKPRRFYCSFCRHVFTETVLITRYQRVTQKYKREVIHNLSSQSFSSGSKKYGVSYNTQRKWLHELISDKVCNFTEEEKTNTPFVLGIDEVSFAGKVMMTTIGNITTHRLKGLLYSKNKQELKKMIRSLSLTVKSLISEVVIDMCEMYLHAVKEVLPNALIVADHFHIIHDANRKLDEARLLLQDIYKKRIPRYILTKNKEDLKGEQTERLASIIKHYP